MSDGTVIEHCPLADSVMSALASAIARRGGAILIVDYGSNGNPGDSLQAVAAQKPVDIFHMPGAADLSHWVDFAALGSNAAAGSLVAVAGNANAAVAAADIVFYGHGSAHANFIALSPNSTIVEFTLALRSGIVPQVTQPRVPRRFVP